MVYLDYASTTPLKDEVYQKMLPYIKDYFGNPSSKFYEEAVNAQAALKDSRTVIADYFRVDVDEIVFTSGGTESNNMIIKGIAFLNPDCHMITTAIEHSSVLETFEYLKSIGMDITFLQPDKTGKIDAKELSNSIKKNTRLISVGWVNSEIGTIQDINLLSQIAAKNGIYFHTDATQAVPKFLVNLNDYKYIDFLSCSSHKIYGPKGSGVVVIKKDTDGLPVKLTPLIHGGSQENGFRGGTEALPNIVGMAEAFKLLERDIINHHKKLKDLDEYFVNKFQSKLKNAIEINNLNFDRVPGIINIRFHGINNQLFLKKAKSFVAASTGSACSNTKPSKVLMGIGRTNKEIHESIRFSLSHLTQKKDIDSFINQLI